MKPGGKIGFFDSGLGGLIIARDVMNQLPAYSYLYLGDTAHKPYGSQPAADIRGLVQQGVSYLFDQGCELVVVTCNTAAAQALSFIQRQFLPTYAPHRHVLGVILPAAQAAVMSTKNNRIGVLATQATVETHVFAEEIQNLRPQVAVYQQSAPELIPLIESGLYHGREMAMVLRHYLRSLQGAGVDTLVLGCGQYELIAPQIAEIMGSGVTLIHEGPPTANTVQDYLFRNPDLSHRLVQGSERKFCFTGNAAVFAGLSQEFYGAPITAEEVTLK